MWAALTEAWAIYQLNRIVRRAERYSDFDDADFVTLLDRVKALRGIAVHEKGPR